MIQILEIESQGDLNLDHIGRYQTYDLKFHFYIPVGDQNLKNDLHVHVWF